MPTMRGRNTGIQDDVFISATREVELIDPFVVTDLPLPDLSYAELTLKTELKNYSDKLCSGRVGRGNSPGKYPFQSGDNIDGLRTERIGFR